MIKIVDPNDQQFIRLDLAVDPESGSYRTSEPVNLKSASAGNYTVEAEYEGGIDKAYFVVKDVVVQTAPEPDTHIMSATDGNDNTISAGANTDSPIAKFTFTGTEGSDNDVQQELSFECRLLDESSNNIINQDNKEFESCTSPLRYSKLPGGSYTFGQGRR